MKPPYVDRPYSEIEFPPSEELQQKARTVALRDRLRVLLPKISARITHFSYTLYYEPDA